jgi:hypothetical protein
VKNILVTLVSSLVGSSFAFGYDDPTFTVVEGGLKVDCRIQNNGFDTQVTAYEIFRGPGNLAAAFTVDTLLIDRLLPPSFKRPFNYKHWGEMNTKSPGMRLFGMGDEKSLQNAQVVSEFLVPDEILYAFVPGLYEKSKQILDDQNFSVSAQELKNGFLKPLTIPVLNKQKDNIMTQSGDLICK